MQCPFCLAEKDDRAPVCPTCNRDTAIPELLLKERDDLVRKRDLLRDELAMKEARIAQRRLLTGNA